MKCFLSNKTTLHNKDYIAHAMLYPSGQRPTPFCHHWSPIFGLTTPDIASNFSFKGEVTKIDGRFQIMSTCLSLSGLFVLNPLSHYRSLSPSNLPFS